MLKERGAWRIGLAMALSATLAAAPGLAADDSILRRFGASLTTLPAIPLPTKGSIYVPAYSSVSLSQGRIRADFSVTLSLHNLSEQAPLVVSRIAYFDTSGTLVQDYVAKPIALKPFATIEVFIPVNDVRGGTGANFVIDWAMAEGGAAPLAEALMIGGLGTSNYAFVSQGRPIAPARRD